MWTAPFFWVVEVVEEGAVLLLEGVVEFVLLLEAPESCDVRTRRKVVRALRTVALCLLQLQG